MRRSALLVVIGVLALAGTDAAARPHETIPPYGFPLRQAPSCAGARTCIGDRDPAFSPDGSQIAFLRGDSTVFDLMVMSNDGSQVRRLAAHVALEQPVWADAGTIDYGCRPLVCSVRLSDGAITLLSPPTGVPESVPVVSPDGRRLAYVRRTPTASVVVVSDPGEQQPRVLGGVAPDEWWSPAWSPDGKQLAFVRGPTAVEGALWVVGADGASPRLVVATVDGAAISSVVGWQAGTEIGLEAAHALVFVLTSDHWLASIDPSSGATRALAANVDSAVADPVVGYSYTQTGNDGLERLKTPPFDAAFEDTIVGTGPSVQARPTALSFSVTTTTAPETFAFTTDGECPALLGIYVVRQDAVEAGAHRISERCRRDGTSHADTLRGTAGTDALYGLDGADTLSGEGAADFLSGGPGNDVLDGGPGDDRLVGGPGRDTISGGDGWDAIISRDGERDRVSCGPGRDIVWADPADVVASDCEVVVRAEAAAFPRDGSIAITTPDGLPPSVWSISPRGGALHLVTTPTFPNYAPRWSPDGRTLAYVLGRPYAAIWLHVHGRPDRHLPVTTSDVASWFPDGTLLVARRTSGTTVFTKVTTSGKATRLFALPSYAFSPDLSHDGKRIAFEDKRHRIWMVGVDGRNLTHITDAVGGAPRWSSDDTRLAYFDDTVHIVEVVGGATHEVLVGDLQPEAFAWSPRGPWLAVADDHDYECADPTGPCTVEDLWLVNVDTGAAQRIYRGDRFMTGLDWR